VSDESVKNSITGNGKDAMGNIAHAKAKTMFSARDLKTFLAALEPLFEKSVSVDG